MQPREETLPRIPNGTKHDAKDLLAYIDNLLRLFSAKLDEKKIETLQTLKKNDLTKRRKEKEFPIINDALRNLHFAGSALIDEKDPDKIKIQNTSTKSDDGYQILVGLISAKLGVKSELAEKIIAAYTQGLASLASVLLNMYLDTLGLVASLKGNTVDIIKRIEGGVPQIYLVTSHSDVNIVDRSNPENIKSLGPLILVSKMIVTKDNKEQCGFRPEYISSASPEINNIFSSKFVKAQDLLNPKSPSGVFGKNDEEDPEIRRIKFNSPLNRR